MSMHNIGFLGKKINIYQFFLDGVCADSKHPDISGERMCTILVNHLED